MIGPFSPALLSPGEGGQVSRGKKKKGVNHPLALLLFSAFLIDILLARRELCKREGKERSSRSPSLAPGERWSGKGKEEGEKNKRSRWHHQPNFLIDPMVSLVGEREREREVPGKGGKRMARHGPPSLSTTTTSYFKIYRLLTKWRKEGRETWEEEKEGKKIAVDATFGFFFSPTAFVATRGEVREGIGTQGKKENLVKGGEKGKRRIRCHYQHLLLYCLSPCHQIPYKRMNEKKKKKQKNPHPPPQKKNPKKNAPPPPKKRKKNPKKRKKRKPQKREKKKKKKNQTTPPPLPSRDGDRGGGGKRFLQKKEKERKKRGSHR